MDSLKTLLHEQFGAVLAEDLERRASYYREMDFLEYVAKDTTTVSQRIDNCLTLLLDADSRETIGFRFKGFGYVFNTVIRPLVKLREEDFDPLITAMEFVFTTLGNDCLPGLRPDEERRLLAYKKAREIAKRDQVKLPEEFRLEAA